MHAYDLGQPSARTVKKKIKSWVSYARTVPRLGYQVHPSKKAHSGRLSAAQNLAAGHLRT